MKRTEINRFYLPYRRLLPQWNFHAVETMRIKDKCVEGADKRVHNNREIIPVAKFEKLTGS